MNIIITDIEQLLNLYQPFSGHIKLYSLNFTADWYNSRNNTDMISVKNTATKVVKLLDINQNTIISFKTIEDAIQKKNIKDLQFAATYDKRLAFTIPKGYEVQIAPELRKMLDSSLSTEISHKVLSIHMD